MPEISACLDAQLLEALAEVPERWWFAAHTNDCLTREFGKTEPKRALQVCNLFLH